VKCIEVKTIEKLIFLSLNVMAFNAAPVFSDFAIVFITVLYASIDDKLLIISKLFHNAPSCMFE
jgi:hypothetical protein